MNKIFVCIAFFVFMCSLQTKAQRNNELLITATSVGPIYLGLSIQDAILLAKQKYKVEDFENGFVATLDGENLFYFGRKSKDETVGFIEIYSSIFYTNNGIRVGLSIAKAVENGSIKMGFDGLSGEEYLMSEQLQIPNEKFYESLCLFYVTSSKDELLGDYTLTDNTETTEKFKTDGYISRILIYYW